MAPFNMLDPENTGLPMDPNDPRAQALVAKPQPAGLVSAPGAPQQPFTGRSTDFSSNRKMLADRLGHDRPFSPEFFQDKEAILQAEKSNPFGTVGNRPGLVGKIEHGLAKAGNIAGDIFAPGTMSMIPGTELHRDLEERKNRTGYEGAVRAEEERALAHKALNPLDKYSFHYQDADGNEWGVRPDGTPEQIQAPAGQQTPGMQRQKNVTGYLANPNDPKAKSAVEADPSTWQKNIPFFGNIQNGKLIADPNAKVPITIDRNLITGTVQPVGEAEAKPHTGSGQFKMVPTGADTEAMADFSKPDATTGRPYTIVSPPEKKGTLVPYFNPNDPTQPPVLVDSRSGAVQNPPKMPVGHEGNVSPQQARQQEVNVRQFNTEYEKPYQQQLNMQDLYKQAQKEYDSGDVKTGAATMLMLSQHIGSTFAQIKGTRLNQDLIDEHRDAIGIDDRMNRFVAGIQSGQQLSANQVKEFGDLITKRTQLIQQTIVREALRTHAPLTFLPPDSVIKMKAPGGREIPVPAAKVEAASHDGLQVE